MNDRHKKLLLPISAGIILGLSYPPVPVGFIAWIALIPLIHSLKGADFGESVRRGTLFSFVHCAVALYFINFNSGAPLPLAISSYFGMLLILLFIGPLLAVPYWFLRKKFGEYALIAFPFVWTTTEYIRSWGEIAFPWNILPLTQADYLAPSQIAVITGVWGLSFWVSGINVLAYLAIVKNKRWLYSAMIWVLIPFVYGWIVLGSPSINGKTLNVSIVQGNVDPAGKWANGLNFNIDLYRGLTENIEEADLIVWPETAIPARLNSEIRAKRFLRRFTDDMNIPIFTGALARDEMPNGDVQRFNSAYLAKPNTGSLDRYDKILLVPFGERVPFQKLFPKLGNLNFGQAEFTPGKDFTIFSLTDSVRFGSMICFESVLPVSARQLTLNGADFLVNVTNDGWYGKTSEPLQQALLTRFRAIENRRSLVRAANTGISYMCDPFGRFLTKSELEVEAVLQAEIPICEAESFYTKYGDYFAKTVMYMLLAMILIAVALKDRLFNFAGVGNSK